MAALLAAAREQAERAMVAAPDRAWPVLDRPLRALWIVASAGVLGWLLLSHRRLRRRRAAWSESDIAGERVLVSTDVGPAVVGLARARIVLPRWALALDDRSLALMLAHEREHVRSRDPLLLGVAAIAAALVPWSPAVWWQLHRLRLATEIDCDRRVLRRHPDVRTYGRLLLEVAHHSPASTGLPIAALASPATSLERRIRTMTMRRPRHATAHALGLTGMTALLVVAACEAPRPTAPTPRSSVALQDIRSASASVAPDAGVSIETVRATIAKHLPTLAGAAGRPQRVVVVVDAKGEVAMALHEDLKPAAGASMTFGASIRRSSDASGSRSVVVRPMGTSSARMVDSGGPNRIVLGATSKTSANAPWGNIDPDRIESVEVLKLVPGRLTPDSTAVVWITLRAPGAADPRREPFSFKARMPNGAAGTTTTGSAESRLRITDTVPETRAERVALHRDGDSSRVEVSEIRGARSSIGVGGPLRRTLRGGNGQEPIYVLDGRELSPDEAERRIGAMSKSDLVSVETLTGERAIERFGARAAAGAIVLQSNRRVRSDTTHY
jgi:hypothetical protein